MDELLRKSEALCREHDARLLFLTLFGSRLYGTELPGRSDLDARGVFAPAETALLLGEARHGLHYSSKSGSGRNAAADIDIDLVSVQRWLLEQLPRGEMGAMDLLFAPGHAACTLFCDPVLAEVFAQPLRLLDTVHNRTYAHYCLKQAKKYGIAGSRLGAFKAVAEWLVANRGQQANGARLADCLAEILAACGPTAHCGLAYVQGEPALQLGGKLHAASTPLPVFARRLEAELSRYGDNLEAAGSQVDFKALSHALRALYQMEELLGTGKITFPLRCSAELAAIKQGRYSWQELEPRILGKLSAVDELREAAPFSGRHDRRFAASCVLACYGRA